MKKEGRTDRIKETWKIKEIWNKKRQMPGERSRMRRTGNWMHSGMLWAFLLLAAGFWGIGSGMHRARAALLQQGISQEVLRFHVLANSDSEKDQRIKLQVRDGILEWLEGQLSEEEQNDRERMEKRLEELLPQMKEQTVQILSEAGVSYGAEARLETAVFPETTYGTCTFPSGNYKALRLLLGKAQGHNWWCVLFPKLCFLDCVHAVFPEQSQSTLQEVLTEAEYESLFDPEKDSYRIAFRYF